MNKFLPSLALLLALAPELASAHGLYPIEVGVADGKLIVSGGTPDPDGFARIMYADGTEDALFYPAPNDLKLTDLPGYVVNGIGVGEGLYLNIFPRPAFSNPNDQRILWYWNPSSQSVAIAPNDQTLSILSKRLLGNATLPQHGSTPLAPLLVEEPQPTDIGNHVHPLYYALDNNPAAATGAYGFFAQVSSPNYQTSEPFLVVLNNGLDEADVLTAALAINAANTQPGDFDQDGDVDGADFVIWQTHFPTAAGATLNTGDADFDGDVDGADFAAWQTQFATNSSVVTSSAATSSAANPVPEPDAQSLAVIGLLAGGLILCRRSHQKLAKLLQPAR